MLKDRHDILHLVCIQGDSLARGPKFFYRQNYLKKPLATQTIFSIDYE
jgi:hypothetical protein